MTNFMQDSVVCGACGHVFTASLILSTHTFGSPDLDTRPPEAQRSTMRAWVHRCPGCGYCSRSPSRFDESLRATLQSEAYRAVLTDTSIPELAGSFAAVSLLSDAAGQRRDAGWSLLHAAWACDDAELEVQAASLRGRAADRFLASLGDPGPSGEQPGSREAITVDCLRRSGRFAEALQLIEVGLAKDYGDIIHAVLRLQRVLVTAEDTAGHLLDEAFADGQPVTRRERRPGLSAIIERILARNPGHPPSPPPP